MTIEVGKFIGSGAALRLAPVKLENHSVLLFYSEGITHLEVLDRRSTCTMVCNWWLFSLYWRYWSMTTILFWWVWFLILPHYVYNVIACIIRYTHVLLRHIFVYTMIEFGMTYGTSKVMFETQSLFRFGAGGTESWADNRHVFAVVYHRFCLDSFGSIWWYVNPDRHFLHNTSQYSRSKCVCPCVFYV